jgi:hypothetical protein
MQQMADNLPKEKECNVCHQLKPLSEFFKAKNNKDKLMYLCKECLAKRLKKYRSKWTEERTQRMVILSKKKCHRCHKIKPITEFQKAKYNKDGFSHLCRECSSRKYREYSKIWMDAKSQRKDLPSEKKCLKCHRILQLSYFYKNKSSKDGASLHCIECTKKNNKEYKKKWENNRIRNQKDDYFTLFPSFEKECPKCHRFLPLFAFNKDRNRKDGICWACKECLKKEQKRYIKEWAKNHSKKKNILKEKECRICHRVLPMRMFNKKIRSKTGLASSCKDCDSKRNREYQKIVKLEIEKGQYRFDVPEEKECRKCHRFLPPMEFYRYRRSRDGLTSYCKECNNKRYKDWSSRPEIKEKLKQYKKEYLSKPEIKIRMQEWKRNYNKRPEVKQKMKESHKRYLSKPGIKEQIKKQRKKYAQRPDVKKRLKQYQKEYFSILENVKRRQKYNLGYVQRPEVKERRKKYFKEYMKQPGVKEHINKYKQDYNKRDYAKEKRHQYYLEYKKRPEVIERVKKYLYDYVRRPEVKERRRQNLKNYYKRKKELLGSKITNV